MSTFQGLELARKALFAQQGALYTTGHNIANVNTEGYSRQRVNFETTTPFPVPSRVQPQHAGQMGTGVEIGTVERVRDQFLDLQFRAENSKLGYWETRQEALSRMEELLNEPSDNGLSKTMDSFWQSLQDLAVNPENAGARSVVAQRGLALAETFNHLSKSLQGIQSDLKEQIDASEKGINSLLDRINDLNEQIQKIEPHGFLANDLYDERDRLIDQLSEHMNIKVHYRPSSDSALEIAPGIVSIELLDSSGNSFEQEVYLIDAQDSVDDAVNEMKVEYDDESGLVSGISIGDMTVFGDDAGDANLLESIGSLTALVEAHGYVRNSESNGDYPEILAELDKLASEFATAFNAVHRDGIHLVDDEENVPDFFETSNGATTMTAENITVNSAIIDNPNLIAASDPETGSRNGDNALKLAAVFDDEEITGLETSPRKYLTALIGELGVEGQKAKGMKDSTEILKDQVEHSRMSVSAVSLDEEISNMIKFQHAYNAAARNMTAIDEMIDRIINNMGLVGR